VGVDEAGHGDHRGRVDHLVGISAEALADGGDAIAVDEDLGVLEVADGRIHRDDPATFDQCCGHRFRPPSE
jgi:hypothetical protein